MAAEDRPPDGEMAVETFGPGRRGRRSPRCQVEHVTRGDPDEADVDDLRHVDGRPGASHGHHRGTVWGERQLAQVALALLVAEQQPALAT